MTAGLETFAKVRALHDRATLPGEKAAAASRMEALARSAGMSVEEALSRLDREAQAARQSGPSFDDIFNSPFFREAKAKRERERAELWRRVLAEYGSEEAVFAPGPWEQALAAAVERFVVRKETTGWRNGSLWGWDACSLGDPAPEIVAAIRTAYPMPTSVRQAWAEHQFWDKLGRDREARGVGMGDPAPQVQFREKLIERELNTLSAVGLNDLRARLDYFDWRNDLETAPDPNEERVRLATLRADIERMGQRLREQDTAPVQSGHTEGGVSSTYPSPGAVQSGHGAEGFTRKSQNPPGPSPVQSGHRHRTTADKRRDVLALLNADDPDTAGLSDREIARRAGVSPTTVGTIRRSL